jgi:hypothetical protein
VRALARAERERWAGARPTREKGRERGWSSGLAHAGRKERPGMERGEKREGVLGWAGLLLGWLLLSFPFLFYTQTSKQTHLNSNKFEFKSDKLNTRKIMLQHECTNNFDPMIKKNNTRYKIT